MVFVDSGLRLGYGKENKVFVAGDDIVFCYKNKDGVVNKKIIFKGKNEYRIESESFDNDIIDCTFLIKEGQLLVVTNKKEIKII